ncbi:MAG TPA: NAD-dependent malic enzyme, partial [Stellaceae bacterium]|nr:NAD-dependent malic enzyme [Stellaceae bacterium]
MSPLTSATGLSGIITTPLTGFGLLSDPLLNKGTAFTEAERDAFELHGLLPPHIGTLDEQVSRRLTVLRRFESDLERYAFLRELHDNNETLFFALLTRNLEELLPIVYTPTVGAGCQQFSQLFRKPRGLFLSLPHKERLHQILANPRFDRVEAIVLTDGERILGLGDQGAGGMGIPIGKLALYTACGGIHPATTLPIMLDAGTDNEERLIDPLYLGWRHERVRGNEYDEFVEAVVSAIERRWPHVLLQWEDFAKANASRLLDRYRDRLCTFNDDIQGTAAVAAGTLLAAVDVTGEPLVQQRIAVLGAGSAGCGIAGLLLKMIAEAGLSEREAAGQFFLVDRDGLLVEGMAGLAPFQLPFVQPKSATAGWTLDHPDKVSLLDVVHNARPNVLIGVSGQPGMFSEAVVRAMAQHHRRPVIFPLSNPTARSEATPADLQAWTEGRAVIGTGSPFPPLDRNGSKFRVDQTNNSYVFPGVGLGVIAT